MKSDKKKNLIDACHYILHTLIRRESRKDIRNIMEETGFIALSSTILNQVLGKRYKEAITAMEVHGVIEVNHGFLVGKTSKGFRLVGDHSVANLKSVELDSGSLLYSKISELNEKNEKQLSEIPYITKWYNEKLRINVDEAHDFIEWYRKHLLELLKSNPPKEPFTNEDVVARINIRVNHMILNVQNLQEGHFGLSMVGKDQRLHSVISSIKSELRTLITYDGKPLVSLDLKASQPYLFNLLFEKKLYSKLPNYPLSISTLYPELQDQLFIYSKYKSEHPIIMFVRLAESLYGKGFQGSSFSKIDWTKDFYTIISNMDKELGEKTQTFKSRKEVKKAIMLLLYDKKDYKYKDSKFKKFSQFFPKESELIKLFDKLKGDNFLPILLQRLESNLMLHQVCSMIAIELPDAPIIPVHDCILTTPEYATQVKKIMEKVLSAFVGIMPGITIEKYDSVATLSSLRNTAEEDFHNIINPKKKTLGIRSVLRSALQNRLPDREGKKVITTKDFERYSLPDELD